ncbi:MAG: ABC transporter ATP-binding protein [Sulfurifustaceae bacterium]
MTETILAEVQNLSRYYGNLKAVNEVSFTLRQGEILGFLGPNGAGKTTTMQVLSGNLAPSGGTVRIAGHDLLDEPKAAKAALGYLPEQPPVYRDLTVDEYLDYCAALHRIPRARRIDARETAKAKCGLADVGRRLIGNLSKGYQQRVGIAQAIIHLPPLVILDEPTIGLDPIQIREIRTLIRELGKDHGVILSTHILPEVQATCDRVQIISKGNLVLTDSIDGLSRHLKSAALIAAFRNPPAASEIERLPGVRSVEMQDGGRVRVLHDPEQDPSEHLVRIATERNWGLKEIAPERASLEQIFVELTTTEPAAAETPASEAAA